VIGAAQVAPFDHQDLIRGGPLNLEQNGSAADDGRIEHQVVPPRRDHAARRGEVREGDVGEAVEVGQAAGGDEAVRADVERRQREAIVELSTLAGEPNLVVGLDAIIARARKAKRSAARTKRPARSSKK
jgi:hypothetical protein